MVDGFCLHSLMVTDLSHSVVEFRLQRYKKNPKYANISGNFFKNTSLLHIFCLSFAYFDFFSYLCMLNHLISHETNPFYTIRLPDLRGERCLRPMVGADVR